MIRRLDTATKLKARALIILGVLVSLCASDEVGPRLLPLPVSVESAIQSGQIDQSETATRAPSRARALRARVEMASAPKGRAGAGRQLAHAAAAAPGFNLPSPFVARLLSGDLYSPVRETSASASRQRGRAPPQTA